MPKTFNEEVSIKYWWFYDYWI